MGGDAWVPYPGRRQAGIAGNLMVSRHVLASPDLPRTKRRLLAWLPASYQTGGRRFPVVYMQDGHNLFDEEASYSGAWRVDLAMTKLGAVGIEAIVIGIPSAGDQRHEEYCPWVDLQRGGGAGDAYLQFLVDTVKPFVDTTLPTDPASAATCLAGSSLGGNISLYGTLTHPQVFANAAALSPAFFFGGDGWWPFLRDTTRSDGRLYLDVGGAEAPADPSLNQAYLDGVARTQSILETLGFGPEQLRVIHDPVGTHHEAAWRSRITGALRFLLAGT
jgi:predicted alpha/beta superfamily hydrolase